MLDPYFHKFDAIMKSKGNKRGYVECISRAWESQNHLLRVLYIHTYKEVLEAINREVKGVTIAGGKVGTEYMRIPPQEGGQPFGTLNIACK